MVNAKRNPISIRNVFAVLITLYCLLFLTATIGTIFSLISVNDLLANSARVKGEVIDLKLDAKGRRSPIVRFKAANGEICQLRSDLYTSPAPKVGDLVKVVYRVSNPRDWSIDDWMHLYFWTLIGLIFMFSWAVAIVIAALVAKKVLKASILKS